MNDISGARRPDIFFSAKNPKIFKKNHHRRRYSGGDDFLCFDF
jgi:hypothetical protein